MGKNLFALIITALCVFPAMAEDPIPAATPSDNVTICSANTTQKIQSSSFTQEFAEFFSSLLNTSQFPARWYCGEWSEFHGWLYIGSDVAIWLAYFMIPLVLFYFLIKKRESLPFKGIFTLFIAFILACGLTHLIDAAIFWWPAYKLSAVIRFFTAVVSLSTVFGLMKIIPSVIQLKSPDELLKEIEQRKEVEKKLKASEEKYRSTFKYSSIGIANLNVDGNFLNVNKAFCNLLGYSEEEFFVNDLPSLLQPEDRESVFTILRNIKDQLFDHYESENRFIDKNGKSVLVQLNASGILENGEVQYIVIHAQDISAKKAKINLELEAKVKKRTKQLEIINQELEAFSYSVSHDLRSPLRTIQGFSQAVEEDYNDILPDQAKEYLQRVSKASDRMGNLIDDLLDLSRISRRELVFKQVDLAKLANDIYAQLEKPDDSSFEFLTPPELITKADPGLMRIVLENLLGNAIKYHDAKKKKTIIEMGTYQNENEGTAYFIKDNGVGFDMAFVDKLFGAFQRLHSGKAFQGSGIGLATVKRIISRHEGTVWAKGEVGEGATFYFTIGI